MYPIYKETSNFLCLLFTAIESDMELLEKGRVEANAYDLLHSNLGFKALCLFLF
jgi:hypothetical protein